MAQVLRKIVPEFRCGTGERVVSPRTTGSGDGQLERCRTQFLLGDILRCCRYCRSVKCHVEIEKQEGEF